MSPESHRITMSEAESEFNSGRLVDKHIPRIMTEHPDAFFREEEGEVISQEAPSQKQTKPRLTENNIVGQEVVIQSSKKPLVVRPPLEVSKKDLARERDETHTRVAHWVSEKIALATGFVDGVIDGVGNGVAEITESAAFSVSKTIFGTVHGLQRGKAEGKDQR